MEFISPAGAYTMLSSMGLLVKVNYLSIMHIFPIMEFISPTGAYTMSILYGPTSENKIPLFINNAYISRYGIYQSRRGLYNVYPLWAY